MDWMVRIITQKKKKKKKRVFYNPNSMVIVSHVASIDLLNLNQNNEFFFLKWLRVVVGEILNTKDYTVLDALKPCLCS